MIVAAVIGLMAAIVFAVSPTSITTPRVEAAHIQSQASITSTLYLPLICKPLDWQAKTPPLSTRWTALVSPNNALPEYPRPQLVRSEWLNLNGVWEFASGSAYTTPPIGQTLPETILVPFPVESALSGIMRHESSLWYRRKFNIPEAWMGRRILLHFGAVDWATGIYVNGQYLGAHQGGYDAFSFDITAALQNGDNELIVYVVDPTDTQNPPLGKQRLSPRVIWYTPVSGIWQTVWLEPVPVAHITDLTLTPNIDQPGITVTVVAQNAPFASAEVTVLSGTQTVATATISIGAPFTLPITTPRLWSPDDPFLYDVRVRLIDGGTALDQVGSYLGLRKISLGTVANRLRVLLNNEFVYQTGVLDHGYWPDGLYTAPTDEALRFDLEQAKALGFNLIRKHMKVEPARWYYWADRLGILVWQDMPAMRDDLTPTASQVNQFETELRQMVREHRNAPSVVMWVIFNEGWGQSNTNRMTQAVRSEDASRLIDSASGWADLLTGDIIDTHHYVEPIAPTPTITRAAVTGEFGGVGMIVAGHLWNDKAYASEWQPAGLALANRYAQLLQSASLQLQSPGLSGSVYTQLIDVESELNGWLTYDREVLKPAANIVKQANQAIIAASRQLNMKR